MLPSSKSEFTIVIFIIHSSDYVCNITMDKYNGLLRPCQDN